MENKKSFILYADLLSMVEQLPDETAGKLFKTILNYVNDNNPEPEEMLLKIAFEPIKQQLKRDLVKWQEFREKQRQNGMLGGRPQKPKKPKPLNENPTKPNETQKSLNVNVNASVNDTVNEKKTNTIPDLSEFLEFGKACCNKAKLDYNTLSYSIEVKYHAWVAAKWKDGYNGEIKNWKTKLANTLPHLKPILQRTNEKPTW